MIKSCEYKNITLSDHSPVLLQLTLGYKQSAQIWRFDNSLITNKQGLEEIGNQIKFYLSFNNTPDTNISFVWEAVKAYIRGQVISWKSLMNKQHIEREERLKSELTDIDRQHSSMPSATLHTKKQKSYPRLFTKQAFL